RSPCDNFGGIMSSAGSAAASSARGFAAGANEVLMVIADISGYTRFMVSHRKALAHAEIIVGRLLEAVENQLRPTLTVVKREGDASFLYCVKAGRRASADQAAALGRGLVGAFREFARVLAETAASVICKCEACAAIARLELKIIVRSGSAIVVESA